MGKFVAAARQGLRGPIVETGGKRQGGRLDVADIKGKLLISSLFLLLGFMVGCGGGSSSPSGPLSITVSPGGAVVSLGGTQSFTATVSNDPKNQGASWTLTQNGIACSPACGSLSETTTASGKATVYTAPGTAMSVVLTAATVTNAVINQQVTITVTGFTAVSVTPSAATVSLNNGATGAVYTQDFSATVANDIQNKGVNWTLTQNGAACSPDCGSVSPTSTKNGVATTYTAPSSTPTAGTTVTLTANSVAFPGQTAWATITISGGLTVTVAPTYVANVPVNGTQTFTATVSNDPSNKGVTWTLTQNGKSCSPGCGTVSPTSTASGAQTTYTAPSSGTTATLTATSVANTKVSGFATITVTPITVTVSPTTGNLYQGDTQSLVANVSNDVSDGGVTWKLTENGTSCSPGCGTISPTSTASGAQTTYTAPATLKSAATVNVTATSVTDTKVSSSAVFNLYPPIAVSVSPSTATVATGARTTFTATVANDPTDSGVNWTVMQSGKVCSPTCGYVSPTSTTSGVATTYFAPTKVPSPATVTVQALSIIDVSKTGTATVTVSSSPVAARFSGSYAFAFNGYDSGGSFATAGSFTADANGKITGIEDVNSPAGVTTARAFTGTYTAEPGGRGSFTLTDAKQGTPLGTFRFALDAEGKQAQFTETDGSGTRVSGVMIKRTVTKFSAATLSGGYAFGVSGADPQGQRLALAGRFQANGAGKVSGGVLDANDGGSISAGVPFTGAYTVAPDGRGTLQAVTRNGAMHWAFYVASPKQVFLISTDPRYEGALSSGKAVAQSPAQAGAFSNASLTGTSVIRLAGVAGGGKAARVGAGLVTFDGSGGLDYAIDENSGGRLRTLTGKGTYTVAPGGRVTMTLDSPGSPLISYLTGRNKALVVGTGLGVSSGELAAQAAGPFSNASLSGSYILRTVAAPTSAGAFQWGMLTSAGLGRITGSAARVGATGAGVPANNFLESYSVAPSGKGLLGSGGMVLYFISPSRAVALDMRPGETNPTISEIVK